MVENNVHKERYLGALKQNNGKLDEEELGQSIGFSKEYTDKIIDELLSDGRIKSQTAGTCRYKPTEEKSGI
ncbi:hypothetical protein DXT99_15800 [Pontibacter diazotrophicus]|uniref:Winged helix-turn-helix domain-containing protein n=1 Tax=Pontibacter diazotrophicus TaxID=1400979 RepID=A0A3D8LAA8_9BACT|nr:hypothetical protein DXT99_15800 [Pontibacter diazotrophicus]